MLLRLLKVLPNVAMMKSDTSVPQHRNVFILLKLRFVMGFAHGDDYFSPDFLKGN